MSSKEVADLTYRVLDGSEELHLVAGVVRDGGGNVTNHGNSRRTKLSDIVAYVTASGGLTQAAADLRYLRDSNIQQTSVGPSGEVSTGSATPHQYWRVLCTLTNGGGNIWEVHELELRETAGIPELPTGGAAISSATYSGSGAAAANAFDGNVASIWASFAPPTVPSPVWIGYNYGAGVHRAINEIALTGADASTFTTQNAVNLQVQYSDDGAAWTTQWSVTGIAWGSALEKQVFTDPSAGGSSNAVHYYPITLAALNDVSINALADGKVLTWVAADQRWEAKPLGTAAAATLDTDATLAANSDTRVPSQKAVLSYIAAKLIGMWDLRGGTDCSANPNYPAATKGDAYVVTVAGKIGGAAGAAVSAGDVYFATADNAGGTQAAVGASWDVIVHASVASGGGLLAANNLSDVASVATARTNLGLGTAATQALDIDGTLAANSDTRVASQKAVKTYVDGHAGAGGSGVLALGSPAGQITVAWNPAVNNYLMKWVVADQAFTINKIAFFATVATATAKFQPFVYAAGNNPAGGGSLLGSGPQVTGAVAGYNEVPLTTPISVAKGQSLWLGVSVINAALNMTAQAGGLYGFAANGGSSVPADPCPALTTQNTANQIYAFWAV